jgi:hypothetical protein
MGTRSRFGRIGGAAAVALAGMAMTAPAASADFHFMKIREVALNLGTDNAYIELQMYAPGQTNVGSHSVTLLLPDGNTLSSFEIPPGSTVPNGENQRTILIGDTGVAGTDFTYSALWDAAQTYGSGGAACFDSVDCVSWGGYTGGTPPDVSSPTGNPAPAIPNGSSLERTIAPNCATLLENADDTNNSLADFFVATPTPRNNATAPTETSCGGGGSNPGGGPDTKIDKGPKKKTKKKRATFEFSSTSVGVTFECSLDGNAPKGAGSFGPCTSPFSVRVKKGKHNFRVRAVLNGVPDGSPAEQSWKVKKPKR